MRNLSYASWSGWPSFTDIRTTRAGTKKDGCMGRSDKWKERRGIKTTGFRNSEVGGFYKGVSVTAVLLGDIVIHLYMLLIHTGKNLMHCPHNIFH